MALRDLQERFLKMPMQNKAGLLVLATAGLGAAFYFLVYADLADKVTNVQSQISQLQSEKAALQQKKQAYLTLRAEVIKLRQVRRENLEKLPSNAEIPALLQALHAQAELAGLNILTFDQQPEVPKGFYAEIPVRMVISGTYHQVLKFFHEMGRPGLPGKPNRIVNFMDVELSAPKETAEGIVLQAKFVATTFRLLSNEGAPPPQGQPG